MSRPPSLASKPPTRAPSHPRRQPANLVSDVLLEILTWLALDDWEFDAYHFRGRPWVGEGKPPGCALVRATHVCRYWRETALENKRLWSNITLNETLSRDYDHTDREFTCRVLRTLGSTHPLRLSYYECPKEEVENQEGAIDRTDYSRAVDPGPGEWVVTYYRLFPILRDCIRRASTLALNGYGDSITDLFGWEDVPRFEPPIMFLNYHRPKHLIALGIGITSLPLLVDLTITLRDQTVTIHFPDLPRLKRLVIRQNADMHAFPFQLPYGTVQHHRSPDSTFPPLPQDRQPLFPDLKHLELYIRDLHLDSFNHFLFNHSATLVDIVLDTTMRDDHTYPCPTSPILLPDVRSFEIATLDPALVAHLNKWECPSLESLRITMASGINEFNTLLLTRNFSGIKRLTFGFPNLIIEDEWLTDSQFNEKTEASRLLTSLLVDMDNLVELTVSGWHYAGRREEEDWFQCLTPQRRPPKPTKVSPLESASKSRPSAMWTKISEEGLMIDEDGNPYQFSDVESSISSDYSHESRDLARVQAYLNEQEAAERKRLERQRRRASSSYSSSSEGEEIDRFARRAPPEYIPGPYYACRALERVELERCVGIEKTMVFDFWAGRQFLYSHYVRTTYGSPGLETTKPVDINPTIERQRRDERLSSSQSCFLSATDSPPQSPTSPGFLCDHAFLPNKSTAPQLYPPPAPSRQGAASTTSFDAAEDETPSVTERVRPSPTVTFVDCKNTTHDEMHDLLWKYYIGYYEPFRPRRPRSPSPIPLDERDLWI